MRFWQALLAAAVALADDAAEKQEVCVVETPGSVTKVNLLQTDLRLNLPAVPIIGASVAEPASKDAAPAAPSASAEATNKATVALAAIQAKSTAGSSTSAVQISVGALCAILIILAVLICGLAFSVASKEEIPGAGTLLSAGQTSGRDLSRMAKYLPGPVQQGPVPASAASLPRVSMAPSRAPASALALQPSSTSVIYARHDRPPTAGVIMPPTGPQTTAGPGDSQATGPPPICPSLILPRDEARFMVVMSSLQQRGLGPIDIYGTSGRKLMHAVVGDQNSGLRVFSVASVGCEHDPRCSIRATATSDRLATLEVFGRNEQPYGALEPVSTPNGAVLLCGGQKVMSIEVEDGISFRMVALSATGTLLASAGPNVAGLGQKMNQETVWRVEVKPRVDAVLVVSCMLSMVLLWPRMLSQGPGSSASFARGGQS